MSAAEIDWGTNTLDWLHQFAERLQWARDEYARVKRAHDARMDTIWSDASWRMDFLRYPHPNDEEKIWWLQAKRRQLAYEMRRAREARLYVLQAGGTAIVWGQG
jgi:hypothetical protein